MELLPTALARMEPPQDDLLEKIFASPLTLADGDVVAISSKVVSIHEGHCVRQEDADLDALVAREAERYLPKEFVPGFHTIHTITRGTLIGRAGIDRSNSNGYFTLLPKDPVRAAWSLRGALMGHFGIERLGVLITDSRSTPMRRGALGVTLGFAGIEPLRDYRGTPDLFGVDMHVEVANIVDGLAAAAVVVMGEGAQGTPVVRIRDVPELSFCDSARDCEAAASLLVSMEEDLFAPFFKDAPWEKGREGS